MQKFLAWLEPLLALAALLAAAAAGLSYLAGYGRHNYNCLAQLLPCIVDTGADVPAGIAAVVVSLMLLGGFSALAILHILHQRRIFLYVMLVIASGYWIGFMVVAGGFFVWAYQISAGCLVIACLAAVMRQLDARRLRIQPALVVVSSSAVVWMLSGFAAASFARCMPFSFPICIPNIEPLPPDAQDSLLYAVPIGYDASGQFIGYDQFTADELNRIHQGSKLRPLHFVDGNTPSTAPDIVSVNPIDHLTWSEVALSSSGQCYAFLIGGQHRYRSYSNRYYGVLPAGTACVASAATPATVNSTQWPTAN